MKELLVRPGSNLADNGRLEIHEDGARDVLASSSLGEERREVLVVHSVRNRSVGVDAVLQAVQLPARVADLATRLKNSIRTCNSDLWFTWPTWMEMTSRMIQKLELNSSSLDGRDFKISTKNGVSRKALRTRFYAGHFSSQPLKTIQTAGA
jgi:hypothetical protein